MTAYYSHTTLEVLEHIVLCVFVSIFRYHYLLTFSLKTSSYKYQLTSERTKQQSKFEDNWDLLGSLC